MIQPKSMSALASNDIPASTLASKANAFCFARHVIDGYCLPRESGPIIRHAFRNRA